MTDRREFLQAGLAVSILGGTLLTSASASGAHLAGGPVVPLHKVLVDASLPDGIAFGAEVARHGASVHTFSNGDITDFWYNELDLLWRERRAAIAGLTRHGPLFVLERFAWDRGMRVVFRAEHEPANAGVRHLLSGPSASLVGVADLLKSGSGWPTAMARGVAQCALGCSPPSELEVASAGRLAQSESVYSWLIA